MAEDQVPESAVSIQPELLAAVKTIVAKYLEFHRLATFVELIKIIREQKKIKNITISNLQIKAAVGGKEVE